MRHMPGTSDSSWKLGCAQILPTPRSRDTVCPFSEIIASARGKRPAVRTSGRSGNLDHRLVLVTSATETQQHLLSGRCLSFPNVHPRDGLLPNITLGKGPARMTRPCSHSRRLQYSRFGSSSISQRANQGRTARVYCKHSASSHVSSPTRFGTGNKQYMLHLVLTNEELMIENLRMESPLGHSNHVTTSHEATRYADYQKEHSHLFRTITNYDVQAELVGNAIWGFFDDCSIDSA